MLLHFISFNLNSLKSAIPIIKKDYLTSILIFKKCNYLKLKKFEKNQSIINVINICDKAGKKGKKFFILYYIFFYIYI